MKKSIVLMIGLALAAGASYARRDKTNIAEETYGQAQLCQVELDMGNIRGKNCLSFYIAYEGGKHIFEEYLDNIGKRGLTDSEEIADTMYTVRLIKNLVEIGDPLVRRYERESGPHMDEIRKEEQEQAKKGGSSEKAEGREKGSGP